MTNVLLSTQLESDLLSRKQRPGQQYTITANYLVDLIRKIRTLEQAAFVIPKEVNKDEN